MSDPTPVLVVDDDRDVADSTAQVLTAHGFDARPAYSCAGALEAVRGFRPAVVLLDLRLGDGSGHALAGQLERALGYRPTFAAVTGLDGQESRSRYAGFDHHLVKPVPPAVLVELVRYFAPPVS